MADPDFTTAFTVDSSPDEAFAAINDVRGWWSQEVAGRTAVLGDTFTFEVPGVHRTTQTVTESVPGRRVTWHVTDGWIGFVEDTTEWDGTDIRFDITDLGGRTEVRLTHAGLVPDVACFDVCSVAWSSYMTESLRDLITTGRGHPHRAEGGTAAETAADARAVSVTSG